MSGIKELYLSYPPLPFLGYQVDRGRTPLSFVGVPLDVTSTFKPGSRFAPNYVRLVSQSLETYSLRSGLDLNDYGVFDEGDINVVFGDVEKSLRAIEIVASELFSENRKVVFIGGEHIISYAIVRALYRRFGSGTFVIIFDAHADMRSEYLGVKYSHACVTRRILELLSPNNIFLIGIRALCSDEVKDLRRFRVAYVTSMDIHRFGIKECLRRLRDLVSTFKAIHISIDIDVFDPAFAPAVSTPEPEGLTPTQVLDILYNIVDSRVASLDITEYAPLTDISYSTAALVGKIAIEFYTYVLKSMKIRQEK